MVDYNFNFKEPKPSHFTGRTEDGQHIPIETEEDIQRAREVFAHYSDGRVELVKSRVAGKDHGRSTVRHYGIEAPLSSDDIERMIKERKEWLKSYKAELDEE